MGIGKNGIRGSGDDACLPAVAKAGLTSSGRRMTALYPTPDPAGAGRAFAH